MRVSLSRDAATGKVTWYGQSGSSVSSGLVPRAGREKKCVIRPGGVRSTVTFEWLSVPLGYGLDRPDVAATWPAIGSVEARSDGLHGPDDAMKRHFREVLEADPQRTWEMSKRKVAAETVLWAAARALPFPYALPKVAEPMSVGEVLRLADLRGHGLIQLTSSIGVVAALQMLGAMVTEGPMREAIEHGFAIVNGVEPLTEDWWWAVEKWGAGPAPTATETPGYVFNPDPPPLSDTVNAAPPGWRTAPGIDDLLRRDDPVPPAEAFETPCQTCGGLGQVPPEAFRMRRFREMWKPCPECSGQKGGEK